MIRFLQLTPFIPITFALLLGVVGGVWGLLASLPLLFVSLRSGRVLIIVVAAGFLLGHLAEHKDNKYVANSDSKISLCVSDLRVVIDNKIDSMLLDSSDRSVLKAIVIGEKSGITPATRSQYANCGVAHMLAISGFHIGVIFLILNLITFKLDDIKLLKYCKLIIIVGVLWFYALLSGLSPSVVRAVIMFSLFQISTLFISSRYQAYNVLAFTFMIMVVFDPNIVESVSFQLSFMAMSAIVIFREAVERMVLGKNIVLRYTLSAMLLSAIISLFTAPMTLYYFGQASIIGILSNLIFSILMFPMYGLVMLALLCGFGWASEGVRLLFGVMNYLLGLFESIDWLYFVDVKFDVVDMFLGYLFILFTTILFFRSVGGNNEKKSKFAGFKNKNLKL